MVQEILEASCYLEGANVLTNRVEVLAGDGPSAREIENCREVLKEFMRMPGVGDWSQILSYRSIYKSVRLTKQLCGQGYSQTIPLAQKRTMDRGLQASSAFLFTYCGCLQLQEWPSRQRSDKATTRNRVLDT